jgi:hypothetical protein
MVNTHCALFIEIGIESQVQTLLGHVSGTAINAEIVQVESAAKAGQAHVRFRDYTGVSRGAKHDLIE